MKFGNESGHGKQSVPGRPIVFRRRSGQGPLGIIGQEGESPPPGYFVLTGSEPQSPSLAVDPSAGDADRAVGHSPQTIALIETLCRQYGKTPNTGVIQ
jgi:hypothetical protein